MKTHQPPYPRPVPVIDCDEIESFPDTIVYEDGAQNVEVNTHNDPERRNAKRRRIEEAAQSYLRGYELHITSAGLKGPLSSGWQNPWNSHSRRSTYATGNERESMLHATRAHASTHSRQYNKSVAKVDAVKSLRRREVDLNPIPKSASLGKQGSSVRQRSDQKVEAWLHTNPVLQNEEFATSSQFLSSPTTLKKRSENQGVDEPIHHQQAATPSTTGVATRTQRKPLESHSKLQDVLKTDPMPTSSKNNVRDDPLSQIEEPHSQARAETAIRQIKTEKKEIFGDTSENDSDDKLQPSNTATKLIRKIDADTEDVVEDAFSQLTPNSPSSSQPAVGVAKAEEQSLGQVRRTTDTNAATVAQHEDASYVRKTSNPTETNNHGQMPPPPTFHSEPSTADMLPSAQRQPDVQVSNSNLFEEVRPLEYTASHVESHREANGSIQTSTRNNEDYAKSGFTCTSSHQTKPAIDHPAEEETPRKQADLKDNGSQNESVTPKASNRTIKKPKKHASFTADTERISFNGSIKSALKVGKSMVGLELSSQKRKMMDVEGPDENALSQGSPPAKRSVNISIREELTASKPVRSILKNSNASSSSHPSHQRAASSIFFQREQDQDRRDLDGQNGKHDHHEQFDLDGAIDDLGSFLSTWDPEKEAQLMVD